MAVSASVTATSPMSRPGRSRRGRTVRRRARDSESGSERRSGPSAAAATGPAASAPAPPPDRDSPAATKAYSSMVSSGTAAVAVPVNSTVSPSGSALNVPRALWYSTSSLTSSVFLPLPGDGERAGQHAGGHMRGPPHSGVGVGDRMPYRVDRKCGGHLQFGGPLELGRRVLRVGHRVRPPDAADVVVQAGVLQPAVSWPRIEEFLRLFRAPARGVEITSEDVDPAALQQNTMDVQRLLDLPPVPLGVAETLVGVVELLDRRARSGRSTASIATHRAPACPRRSPDRTRAPGLVPVPDRPPPRPLSPVRISFSPLPNSQPRASARAPARRSHGSASGSRPVSMQNLPYDVAPNTRR